MRKGEHKGLIDLDIEYVLGAFGEKLFVQAAQREWLEYVSGAAISLEHRMVDHIPHICPSISRQYHGHPRHRAECYKPQVCQLIATSCAPALQYRCGS